MLYCEVDMPDFREKNHLFYLQASANYMVIFTQCFILHKGAKSDFFRSDINVII